jgi:malate dehydrogenase
VNSIHTAPPKGEWASLAVVSRGEYGAPEGLQYGYPVASDGTGGWSVVEGLTHDDFAAEKLAVTTAELESERDEVRTLGLI